MTRTRVLCVVLMLVAAGAAMAGRQSSPAASLFQQGLLLERAEGNVAQAIVLFERAVADHPTDPAAPQILAHLARLYESRRDARADFMWTRLRREYSRSEYAAEAGRMLAAGQQQAGPFRMKTVEARVPDPHSESVVPSPDARSLAIGRESGFWVRDLDTGRERKIFSVAGRQVGWPQWSPDSRRLAFVTNTSANNGEPPDNRPHDVRVVTVQTGQSRTIATASAGRTFFDWSPDSRWLVLQVGAIPVGIETAGDIRLVDVMTGVSSILAGRAVPTELFAWSRDSRQVVFQTWKIPAGNGPIEDSFWNADVETGHVKPWTLPLDPAAGRINIAVGMSRQWTTDGRVVVRQVGARGTPNTLYLVPGSGAGQAERSCVVAPPLQCLAQMTADGRIRLGTDATTKRVVLVDVAREGMLTPLNEGFWEEAHARLSNDGRLVAFASNRDGEWALYTTPLDRAPAAAPLRVASLSHEVAVNAWSDDGRLVTYSWQDEHEVYRINMDRNGRGSGPARRLTQSLRNNTAPAVGPDSQSVAFRYGGGIGVMTAAGVAERPILRGAPSGSLQWHSADQVLIEHRVDAATESTSLALLNVNTGAVQLFMDLPLVGGWQFVPFRNEVFYVPFDPTTGASSLRARSVATGADRAIATFGNLSARDLSFRVSPDGTQIAYGRWSGNGPELHLMTIDGQDDRVLPTDSRPTRSLRSGRPYDWSPDGRFLLYAGSPPGQLMVMDVRTAESWPLRQAEDEDPVGWGRAQWAPDGSFIVIERSSGREEWALVDGVTYDNVTQAMKAKK